MDLCRLEVLIGEKVNDLKNLNILIIGLGGVGGYTLESLVRSGVENITIADYDTIESSNINRQLICLSDNIGNKKTTEWKKRALKINNNCNINIIDKCVKISDVKSFGNFDYIIDTCDDTNLKVELIIYANENKINLISCMGTAKKIDATKLKITKLEKTKNDPLAKKIRSELRKRKASLKCTVVSSEEQPLKNADLGTTSYVPAVAGLLITNQIFNDILKKTVD